MNPDNPTVRAAVHLPNLPTDFNPDKWATAAKAAGMKYLVFTTKHHEGFALHDSAVTDFDAGSVLNRDLGCVASKVLTWDGDAIAGIGALKTLGESVMTSFVRTMVSPVTGSFTVSHEARP